LSVAYCQDDLVSVYDKVLALKGRTSGFQIADRQAHEHPELAQQRDDVRLARRALNDVAFSENRDELDWTERLLKATQDKEMAENRLAVGPRPIITAQAQSWDRDVTLSEFQSALPSGTAFVDFLQYVPKTRPPSGRGCLLYEPHFLAFIVKASGSPVCVDL